MNRYELFSIISRAILAGVALVGAGCIGSLIQRDIDQARELEMWRTASKSSLIDCKQARIAAECAALNAGRECVVQQLEDVK